MVLRVWFSILLLFAFLVVYLVWSLRADERPPMPALRFLADVFALRAHAIAAAA